MLEDGLPDAGRVIAGEQALAMSTPHCEFVGHDELKALLRAVRYTIDRVREWPARDHWIACERKLCEALGEETEYGDDLSD